jgi:hypothetical protein
MKQFLQQFPSCPIGQGFVSSARLKAVDTPSALALSSISITTGSMLLLIGSELFFSAIFTPLTKVIGLAIHHS